jgi:putative salt-induced outer membrane protein
LLPIQASADQIPVSLEKMIRVAAESGDTAILESTVDLAKKANPQSAPEIDALVAQLKASAETRRIAKLRHQGFFQGWSGQGEAGASYTTGNTRNTGIALGASLVRDGWHWKHALTGSVDYQSTDGVKQKERYFAGYEGQYKIIDRLYTLGLLSWERDRFAGFTSRLSESLGIGYSVIKTPDMTFDIEGGPALRQTHDIVGNSKNEFAGRVAINYMWNILPTLTFTQKASFYGQRDDSTLTSETALTAKLIGSLSARVSFLVQYESSPPLSLESTDTTSRVTLVYSF